MTSKYYCRTNTYVLWTLEGFNVCMDSVLFNGTDIGDRTISHLLGDLQYIKALLEPTIFNFLRDNTNIYVEVNNLDFPGAVYHPNGVWLTDNGYPAYWEKALMIGNPYNYLSWTECQPAMILHELSHSWNDQYLGYSY